LTTVSEVAKVLADVLQVGSRAEKWDSSTSLLGSIPELDSLAVVGVIGALEEHFRISVADDEISAETFSTVGSLSAFIDTKLHARFGNRQSAPPPGYS
jgi:acyl carrier protein